MNQKGSIVTKFTVIYLIALIITAGAAVVIVNNAAQDIFREEQQNNLRNSAGIMATQVNSTQVLLLGPGDEGSPLYLDLAHQLELMRSNNEYIVNAYIMKVDDDQKIEFIIDDFWLEDPDQSAMIGELYDSPDKDRIFMALSVPTSSEDVYEDKWGSYLSGYAPVRDQGGNTVAVLGIDMEASRPVDAASGFFAMLLAVVIIIVLVGEIVVFLYSRSIARDLAALSGSIEKISAGERGVEIDDSRNDEIGDLASAIAGLEREM